MSTIKLSVLVSAFFLLAGINVNAQDAATILKKMDDVMFSPKDVTAKNKIILIDKAGKQEIREATLQQKGTDKRIFRFTSPASQAGIAVLSLPNDIVLELTPKGQSDYLKIIVSINKTNYYPESMEYYDKGNNKVKVARYTFKKIGNYWNALEVEMTDLKKNNK